MQASLFYIKCKQFLICCYFLLLLALYFFIYLCRRHLLAVTQTTKINGRSTSGYGKLAEADFTAYCIIDLTFRQLDSRYRLEILTAVWRHQQAPVSVLLGFYLEKRRRSGQKFQKKSCVITHECFYRISSKIYPRQIKAW